jgi:LysM repeat protein
MGLLGCMMLCFSVTATPLDSIKVNKVRGTFYIIHKVDKGDGLFALAKRYGTTIDEIKKVNPRLKQLKPGQKINIPINLLSVKTEKTTPNDTVKITVDESHANADSKDMSLSKIHNVSSGETLTKIAAKYKISLQQLLKWNTIKNGRIEVGQQLIVSGNVSIKSFERWNTTNSIVSKSDIPKNMLSSSTRTVEEQTMVITTTLNTHPSLPVGSFVLCTNPDTKKQILIQVEQTESLPKGFTIGLKSDVLLGLGYTDPDNIISIKYNQP